MTNRANSINIKYPDLLLLTSKTGLFVSCGTLFYSNGYRVMMNNEPNSEFKFYNGTKRGQDLYTNIEHMRSKYTDSETFFVTTFDKLSFKVKFENSELVQCYKI